MRALPLGSRAAVLAVAAALAIWPRPARAYRPFDSTDAGVTPKGEAEIELGPVGYLAEGPSRALTIPSLVLNWGVAEGWEAVLEGIGLLELASAPGLPRTRVEDTFFSLKGVLREGYLQGKDGPSVATELSALLPTLHGEPGAGAEWAFIVSQRWPDLTVHVNAAAVWARRQVPGVFGGVILEGHDSWAVRPVAEVWAERDGDFPSIVSGLAGAIWRVSERLSLDAAIRRASAGGTSATELRAGLTWGFEVGFPR